MNPIIGELIKIDQPRDAIHVPTMPVVAGMTLSPGTKVKIIDGKAYDTDTEVIGVIDPFYPYVVYENQVITLWIRPGSISSLNHSWVHPKIDAAAAESKLDKESAIKWLTNYSNNILELTYEQVMSITKNYLINGEKCIKDRFEGEYFPNKEFWVYYFTALDKPINIPEEYQFFHCGGCGNESEDPEV